MNVLLNLLLLNFLTYSQYTTKNNIIIIERIIYLFIFLNDQVSLSVTNDFIFFDFFQHDRTLTND